MVVVSDLTKGSARYMSTLHKKFLVGYTEFYFHYICCKISSDFSEVHANHSNRLIASG